LQRVLPAWSHRSHRVCCLPGPTACAACLVPPRVLPTWSHHDLSWFVALCASRLLSWGWAGSQVLFFKSTIFRSKIVSSSHEGATTCYTLWYDLVKKHLEGAPITPTRCVVCACAWCVLVLVCVCVLVHVLVRACVCVYAFVGQLCRCSVHGLWPPCLCVCVCVCPREAPPLLPSAQATGSTAPSSAPAPPSVPPALPVGAGVGGLATAGPQGPTSSTSTSTTTRGGAQRAGAPAPGEPAAAQAGSATTGRVEGGSGGGGPGPGPLVFNERPSTGSQGASQHATGMGAGTWSSPRGAVATGQRRWMALVVLAFLLGRYSTLVVPTGQCAAPSSPTATSSQGAWKGGWWRVGTCGHRWLPRAALPPTPPVTLFVRVWRLSSRLCPPPPPPPLPAAPRRSPWLLAASCSWWLPCGAGPRGPPSSQPRAVCGIMR
jgi:hypothetical protein